MNNKDWIGNSQSVMATLNASSHSKEERASNDYYATPPLATQELLKAEYFPKSNGNIWEVACGELAITKVLEENDYIVKSSDIINRCGNEVIDFLEYKNKWYGHIITNPPFALATEFVLKALDVIPNGNKIAMFLRIQFLEGVRRRKEIFDKYPPIRIHVSTKNLRCAKNGDFKNATGNASTYAWFIWEKGLYYSPAIHWFNPLI